MEYEKSEAVVCLSDTKDACLYFNKVIPLNLANIIPIEGFNDLEAFEVLHKILPLNLLDHTHPTGLNPSVISYINAYVKAVPNSIGAEFSNEESDQIMRANFPALMQMKNGLVDSLGQSVSSIFGADPDSDTNNQQADPAFILSGLKLVDTSEISWRHIIELREDKESLKKLGRLRRFIFKNYQGMPTSFIEDDILEKISDYEDAVKRWDLKTKDSALNVIFSSKSVVEHTAVTIASIFMGKPLIIPFAVGLDLAFLIGKIKLEIRSHKRDLSAFKRETPVTYLVEVKNLNNNHKKEGLS